MKDLGAVLLSQLQAPLDKLVLPMLSAQDLCQLASTCTGMRLHLHDDSQLPLWRSAAAAVLPQSHSSLGSADLKAIKQSLSAYLAAIHSIRQGQHSAQLRLPLPADQIHSISSLWSTDGDIIVVTGHKAQAGSMVRMSRFGLSSSQCWLASMCPGGLLQAAWCQNADHLSMVYQLTPDRLAWVLLDGQLTTELSRIEMPISPVSSYTLSANGQLLGMAEHALCNESRVGYNKGCLIFHAELHLHLQLAQV